MAGCATVVPSPVSNAQDPCRSREQRRSKEHAHADIDSVRGWRCSTMVDCIGSIEKNYADERSGKRPGTAEYVGDPASSVTQTVPVRRERLRLDPEPVTGANEEGGTDMRADRRP